SRCRLDRHHHAAHDREMQDRRFHRAFLSHSMLREPPLQVRAFALIAEGELRGAKDLVSPIDPATLEIPQNRVGAKGFAGVARPPARKALSIGTTATI